MNFGFEISDSVSECRLLDKPQAYFTSKRVGFVLAQMVKIEGSLIPNFDSGTYVIDAVDSENKKIFSKFF